MKDVKVSMPLKKCKDLIFNIRFRDLKTAETKSNENHMIFLAWRTILVCDGSGVGTFKTPGPNEKWIDFKDKTFCTHLSIEFNYWTYWNTFSCLWLWQNSWDKQGKPNTVSCPMIHVQLNNTIEVLESNVVRALGLMYGLYWELGKSADSKSLMRTDRQTFCQTVELGLFCVDFVWTKCLEGTNITDVTDIATSYGYDTYDVDEPDILSIEHDQDQQWLGRPVQNHSIRLSYIVPVPTQILTRPQLLITSNKLVMSKQ